MPTFVVLGLRQLSSLGTRHVAFGPCTSAPASTYNASLMDAEGMKVLCAANPQSCHHFVGRPDPSSGTWATITVGTDTVRALCKRSTTRTLPHPHCMPQQDDETNAHSPTLSVGSRSASTSTSRIAAAPPQSRHAAALGSYSAPGGMHRCRSS